MIYSGSFMFVNIYIYISSFSLINSKKLPTMNCSFVILFRWRPTSMYSVFLCLLLSEYQYKFLITNLHFFLLFWYHHLLNSYHCQKPVPDMMWLHHRKKYNKQWGAGKIVVHILVLVISKMFKVKLIRYRRISICIPEGWWMN